MPPFRHVSVDLLMEGDAGSTPLVCMPDLAYAGATPETCAVWVTPPPPAAAAASSSASDTSKPPTVVLRLTNHHSFDLYQATAVFAGGRCRTTGHLFPSKCETLRLGPLADAGFPLRIEWRRAEHFGIHAYRVIDREPRVAFVLQLRGGVPAPAHWPSTRSGSTAGRTLGAPPAQRVARPPPPPAPVASSSGNDIASSRKTRRGRKQSTGVSAHLSQTSTPYARPSAPSSSSSSATRLPPQPAVRLGVAAPPPGTIPLPHQVRAADVSSATSFRGTTTSFVFSSFPSERQVIDLVSTDEDEGMDVDDVQPVPPPPPPRPVPGPAPAHRGGGAREDSIIVLSSSSDDDASTGNRSRAAPMPGLHTRPRGPLARTRSGTAAAPRPHAFETEVIFVDDDDDDDVGVSRAAN
ncbi:hypothetical protein H9P43_000297 [Blastocladiella emersonii ATCC 22665]|nr:hypothetical protein H9P43_000297 [Blastocladiella emersonii ATCC 22665]